MERVFGIPGDGGVAWLDIAESPNKDEILKALRDRLETLKETCVIDPGDNIDVSDHGVLSALRIAQIAYQQGREHSTVPDTHQNQYAPAIHAVVNHNRFEKRLAFKEHPLSCLLRICDELQEWSRARVNMEKLLKRLYLDLQYGFAGELPTHQMLRSIETNLRIKTQSQSAKAQTIEIFLPDKGSPHFLFELNYNDCAKARFDPTMTSLCKAYNLQHINLEVQGNQSQEQLQIRIALKFPLPDGYKNLSEYDFYALFSNDVRNLPLLRQFKSAGVAEAGFVRLLPESNQSLQHTDIFGIIMSGSVAPDSLNGWLPLNPAVYFDKFIRFKADVLAQAKPTL